MKEIHVQLTEAEYVLLYHLLNASQDNQNLCVVDADGYKVQWDASYNLYNKLTKSHGAP